MRLWASLVVSIVLAVAAEKRSQLAIHRPFLHQYEDGPLLRGDEADFGAGETAFFSLDVSGYKKTDADHIRLAWEIKCTDPSGILVVAPASGKVDTDVSPEDRHWMPRIRQTIELPPLAPPGVYHVMAKVHDEVSGQSVDADVPFHVHGRSVETSDTLTVRNFHFYRSENDTEPLATAAYKPGDSVWARFDITGYKLGPENSFDVSYGLSEIRPDGKPGFSQPDAANLKDHSFYPQRYAPAGLSLTLPANVVKGPHTIILTVTDKIGNQKYEIPEKFDVE